MSDSRPLVRSADGVRALCQQCGRSWPVQTLTCPACSDLGGPTVRDDVADAATEILGPGTSPRPGSDTTTNSAKAPAGPGRRLAVPGVDERPMTPSAPRSNRRDRGLGADTPMEIRGDAGLDVDTPWVPRRHRHPPPATSGHSSSDPPTRFLRGIDAHIDLPNGSVVDDYEIDAQLGAGAMGVVYSARHLKLGRRVAIKVMAPRVGADPQALARFEREARALASLHHPNIVDVSAFGSLPDKRGYFVMEYLVGETLEDRLERTRLTLDEALHILDQMARALEAAHAQGIVHRDLKPANTFLARISDERLPAVKLLDFGLAKLAVADGVQKTASGAVIGTALYLSPEQARGPNVDGRTDVYALGCIAYELVLGQHPFPGSTTPTAAIAAHLTEPPPQPRAIWPGIPAELDPLLAAMLAKAPHDRPTLAQVRQVIARIRAARSISAAPPRAATKLVVRDASRSPARRVAPFVLAAAIGIGVGIGALAHRSSDATMPSTLSAGGSSDGAVGPSGDSGAIDAPAPAPAIAPPATPPTTPPKATPPAPPGHTPRVVTPDASPPPDASLPIDASSSPDTSEASPPPAPAIEPTAPATIKKTTTDAPRSPSPPVTPTPPKPIDRNTTINPFKHP